MKNEVKYLWIRNGKICIEISDISEVVVIKNQQDFETFVKPKLSRKTVSYESERFENRIYNWL